jgi:hypothetical protein
MLGTILEGCPSMYNRDYASGLLLFATISKKKK